MGHGEPGGVDGPAVDEEDVRIEGPGGPPAAGAAARQDFEPLAFYEQSHGGQARADSDRLVQKARPAAGRVGGCFVDPGGLEQARPGPTRDGGRRPAQVRGAIASVGPQEQDGYHLRRAMRPSAASSLSSGTVRAKRMKPSPPDPKPDPGEATMPASSRRRSAQRALEAPSGARHQT